MGIFYQVLLVVYHLLELKLDSTWWYLSSFEFIGNDGLKCFEYTDFTLEKVENLLLKEFNIPYLDNKVYDLNELNVTKNLNINEQEILMKYLDVQSFKNGENFIKVL